MKYAIHFALYALLCGFCYSTASLFNIDYVSLVAFAALALATAGRGSGDKADG